MSNSRLIFVCHLNTENFASNLGADTAMNWSDLTMSPKMAISTKNRQKKTCNKAPHLHTPTSASDVQTENNYRHRYAIFTTIHPSGKNSAYAMFTFKIF